MTDAWTLLQARRRASPGDPFVTHVDGPTGARVELSVTSLENAAAKIANALRDELGLDAGATVGLRLPVHWQRSAWCAGAWAAGCAVRVDDDLHGIDLLVTDAATGTALAGTAPVDVAVVSLHPLGLPSGGTLPPGALDVTLLVRQQPDVYLFDPPTARTPALVVGGRLLDQSATLELAAERAAGWHLDHGGRLLAGGDLDLVDGWLAACAVPLAVAGSVLLASGVPDPRGLAAQERVSAFASTP